LTPCTPCCTTSLGSAASPAHLVLGLHLGDVGIRAGSNVSVTDEPPFALEVELKYIR
jgi:hypothetical protein